MKIDKVESFYKYDNTFLNEADNNCVEWYVNFADSNLFGCNLIYNFF